MAKKLTKEEFINKVQLIHGDNICLDEFEYINSITKSKCKCNICGNVWYTRPDVLMNGHGCRKCYDKKNSEKRIIHRDEIQDLIYKNCKTKITMVGDYIDTKHSVEVECEECGHHWFPIVRDLIRGHGCPKCSDTWDGRRRTVDEFIEFSNKIHNNKYTYNINGDYVTNKTYINIICPIHGEFKQLAEAHMLGHGCPKCNNSWMNRHLRVEDFINKANKIHNNQYEYFIDNEYLVNNNLITIKCPKHGVFKQTVKKHLQGQGCPICNESHLERNVSNILTKLGINYNRYKRFKWLGNQSLDFYLPDYNIAIECQGIQHFEPVELFGGVDGYNKTVERDENKFNLVNKHKIEMIYILDRQKYLDICENKAKSFIDLKKFEQFLKNLYISSK